MIKLLNSAIIFSLFVVGHALGQGVQVDNSLKDYTPVAGVAGTIKSVGSDTMNNMMTLWSEGFLKYYPNVRVEIEGKGSSTAPPALISGTSTFGPMSRKMKDAEVDAFEKQYGYKPTQIGTSIDMLAVYVNKDNPVKGLSLAQVDAIFSSTRKLGLNEIVNWEQVDVDGLGAVSLYGRNSASGTYGYFKKNVLGDGDYKASVKEQPGSASVVQGIASDKAGIGYSGIGYKTADVRAVPLASEDGQEAVPATAEFAYSGDYPLARFLWLSVNYKPGSQLDPLRREFLKYIFSRQGQEAVIKDGYFPVNAKVANAALKAVGIQ
ncbi:MAG: phosphate ABC transporter substrate-binding protein [Planctomycetaceae bacterium]|tara:strand:+ start:269 stop:1231 length:963 start_codon:yes stop_codon:yes gene_type:complete